MKAPTSSRQVLTQLNLQKDKPREQIKTRSQKRDRMNRTENVEGSETESTMPKEPDNPFEKTVGLANLSVEMQLKKDSNLDKAATQLMTAITILSVAYISPSQMLFHHYACESIQTTGSQRILAVAYIAILTLLFASLVLTLISRLLRKSQLLNSPKEICEEFTRQVEEKRSKSEGISEKKIAKYYCDSIDGFYWTTRTKNERASKLIEAATILLLLSVSLAVLFLTIAFVGYVS